MENHGSIWESGVTKLELNELDDGGFISRWFGFIFNENHFSVSAGL
jgi:hypothetical protein